VYGWVDKKPNHEGNLVRKTLGFVAVAALAVLWILTAQAIYGTPPLPARIPTHFDFAGNINGWGEPRTLWLLPIIATCVVALIWVVSFFPQSFNYPVRVTPANRPRLEAITISMMAWLQAELASQFLWIQWVIIRSARTGVNTLSPLLLALVIAIIFATVVVHLVAIFRAARGNTHAETPVV
jgi:uncharacterized membrane protein